MPLESPVEVVDAYRKLEAAGIEPLTTVEAVKIGSWWVYMIISVLSSKPGGAPWIVCIV